MIFDRRATRVASRNSLVEYLLIKINLEKDDSRAIGIFQEDSREVYGLQAADLVANTIYKGMEGRNRELMKRFHQTGKLHVDKFPFREFGKD